MGGFPTYKRKDKRRSQGNIDLEIVGFYEFAMVQRNDVLSLLSVSGLDPGGWVSK